MICAIWTQMIIARRNGGVVTGERISGIFFRAFRLPSMTGFRVIICPSSCPHACLLFVSLRCFLRFDPQSRPISWSPLLSHVLYFLSIDNLRLYVYLIYRSRPRLYICEVDKDVQLGTFTEGREICPAIWSSSCRQSLPCLYLGLTTVSRLSIIMKFIGSRRHYFVIPTRGNSR